VSRERIVQPPCRWCGGEIPAKRGPQALYCQVAHYHAATVNRGRRSYDDELVVRFWAKVDKNGPAPAHQPQLGSCWIWTGSISGKTGYGNMNVGGRKVEAAHRLSYRFQNGHIPGGLVVCHRCDIRACVNPAHLFAGTYADNMQDAKRKGRIKRTGPINPRRGENHPKARLQESQVVEIRAAFGCGERQADLARRFAMSAQQINGIIKRRFWRHIA
jgi:hypothetical protein